MNRFAKRLTALEGAGGSDFSHLTDAELDARVLTLFTNLETEGWKLPCDWRKGLATEPAPLLSQVIEDIRCAL